MKQFAAVIIMCFMLQSAIAQDERLNEYLGHAPEWAVPTHKEQLKLTLVIDSVRIGNKTEKLNFQRTFDMNYESDYLQIKDDLYIKIFIARNQEYGKKFYTWKWDYLRKKGGSYSSLGGSYYDPMDYNKPIVPKNHYAQGIGDESEPGYLMFYYRYRLE